MELNNNNNIFEITKIDRTRIFNILKLDSKKVNKYYPLLREIKSTTIIEEMQYNNSSNDSKNCNLIQCYGANMLIKAKRSEWNIGPESIMLNHKANSEYRLSLVNWLFEIRNKFKLSLYTICLAIHLMDYYLVKSHELDKEAILLLGITCAYLAAKYEERVPISLTQMSESLEISRWGFTTNDIANQELMILQVLNCKLFYYSPIYFIGLFITDWNNIYRNQILHKSAKKYITNLKNGAIYFVKFILHYEEFSIYK